MKFALLLITLLSVCVINPFKISGQAKVQDSLALVDLYNSTNGAGWTDASNWLTASPASTWHGVSIANGRVTSLNLAGNNLTGQLPSAIGNLTELGACYLSTNNIGGSIPAALGNLTKLRSLYLSENQFAGTIPASLGNLSALYELILFKNQLTGNLPTELGNLTQLNFLNVALNNLSGIIPASFANLSGLARISISYNNMQGDLSPLSNLSGLSILNVNNNNFTGPMHRLTVICSLNLTWIITILLSMELKALPIGGSRCYIGYTGALPFLIHFPHHCAATSLNTLPVDPVTP